MTGEFHNGKQNTLVDEVVASMPHSSASSRARHSSGLSTAGVLLQRAFARHLESAGGTCRDDAPRQTHRRLRPPGTRSPGQRPRSSPAAAASASRRDTAAALRSARLCRTRRSTPPPGAPANGVCPHPGSTPDADSADTRLPYPLRHLGGRPLGTQSEPVLAMLEQVAVSEEVQDHTGVPEVLRHVGEHRRESEVAVQSPLQRERVRASPDRLQLRQRPRSGMSGSIDLSPLVCPAASALLKLSTAIGGSA